MRNLLFILFCCFSLSLTGCGLKQMGEAVGKMGQVIWDPSTPVGAPEDQPSQVTLSIFAATTVNPNPNSASLDNLNKEVMTVTITATTPDALREQLRLAANKMESPGLATAKQLENMLSSGAIALVDEHIKMVEKPSTTSRDHGKAGAPLPMVTNDRFIAASGSGNVKDANAAGANVPDQPPLEAHMIPELAKAIATPVSFKVLQLKDDSMFLSADFDSLDSDIKAALGTSYIVHDDYVLTPGQFKYIPEMEIDKRTRFIAVYAQFNAMDGAIWKDLTPIESKGRSYNLMISLHENVIAIQPDGATIK